VYGFGRKLKLILIDKNKIMSKEKINKETETKPELYTLLANVIHLNVNGVETHYTDKIWVDDENDPDGGYYQSVKKLYKTPRVKIDFLAKIEVDLEVGCIYTDGLNNFMCIGKNTIINREECVEIFKIPKEVICIYKPYIGCI